MSELAYYLADAFTDEPFKGTQVGVFPEAESLSASQMQLVAKELNLPHCIFLQPTGAHDPTLPAYQARCFTPHGEVGLAAQALVALGFVLVHLGMVPPGQEELLLAIGQGTVPLRFLYEDGRLRLVSVALVTMPIVDAFTPPLEELAAILSLKTGAIETKRFLPKVASCGRPFLIIPLKHRDLVRTARFDFKAWSESAAPMTAAQEILLFSPRAQTPEADFHARLVGPNIGPKEDPPVGEAMPAFCAYLCAHPLRLGTYAFTVERGTEASRRSLLYLEMDHRATDRLHLRLGGKAWLSAAGRVFLP